MEVACQSNSCRMNYHFINVKIGGGTMDFYQFSFEDMQLAEALTKQPGRIVNWIFWEILLFWGISDFLVTISKKAASASKDWHLRLSASPRENNPSHFSDTPPGHH